MKFHWFTIACLPTCWGGGCSTDVSMRMHLQRGLGARGSVTMGNVTGIVRRAKGGPPTMHALPFLPLYFNSDGSEPEMCGNGIRCLARFISDVDKASPRRYKIHTLAGAWGVCVCLCMLGRRKPLQLHSILCWHLANHIIVRTSWLGPPIVLPVPCMKV